MFVAAVVSWSNCESSPLKSERIPRIVESQPKNSSLRFSRALGGGITGVKEELGAFMWSTSPTDMLRLLPWPTALAGVVASRVGMVFLGDGGRGESPKESTFDNTYRGWVYMKLLPLAVAPV
jgi:hypothetical protein